MLFIEAVFLTEDRGIKMPEPRLIRGGKGEEFMKLLPPQSIGKDRAVQRWMNRKFKTPRRRAPPFKLPLHPLFLIIIFLFLLYVLFFILFGQGRRRRPVATRF